MQTKNSEEKKVRIAGYKLLKKNSKFIFHNSFFSELQGEIVRFKRDNYLWAFIIKGMPSETFKRIQMFVTIDQVYYVSK